MLFNPDKEKLQVKTGLGLWRRFAILITWVAIAIPALTQAEDSSVTLTDDRGKTIELTRPATRPAAISTFGADVAKALGVQPVAITTFGLQGAPAYLGPSMDKVPSLGPRHQPNLERLSRIAPDLVFAIRRYTEKDGPQIEAIAPMVALDLITLQDSLNAIALAGEALGRPQEAKRINEQFLARLNSVAARSPGNRTVAILTSGGETPFVYYDHFLTAALLEQLHLDNVGGPPPNPDSGIPLGYRISLEALLTLNPDVIFLLPSNRQRGYTLNPVWPYLQAVKNNQVFEAGQHWKESAGPIARSLVLDDMERLLFPDNARRKTSLR
ncbi:ABC transporter substrate-binding protein [Marinobacter sp. ELB17]|uniref:ABC transporter substrate-binding protein n=1 Tax=Marinobacter sp. ELB17 TaxID=270374 RepID=UPI0000F37B3A|nr:ABC transporter substrate-binding protein [Marinobacter sp. ELB17]EAZ97841.1 probable ferrichrome ABC transporter, substrate-binding protein [Marinobacter sp. ELB17]